MRAPPSSAQHELDSFPNRMATAYPASWSKALSRVSGHRIAVKSQGALATWGDGNRP